MSKGENKREGTMKNIWKLLLLNLSLAAAAILCFSKGFLALSPADPSILKAGLSILIGLGLGSGLVYGNYRLLKEPDKVTKEQLLRPGQVEAALKENSGSRYFGELARTALNQYRRIEGSTARALQAVRGKFQPGSMSESRYAAVIEAAGSTALENMKSIAVRMSIFDDDEYRRLQSYRHDNIPDDIQQQQLALYKSNADYIRQSVAANEALILKLDTLSLEISNSGAATGEDTDALLGAITQLTDELKYYR